MTKQSKLSLAGRQIVSIKPPVEPLKGHSSSVLRLINGARLEFERSLIPPPPLTLPEWADEFRYLSRKSSARPGKWKTKQVEIARGPMLATDEPGVETITLMVATQLLKTELLLNTIGKYIHTDPGPILVVYPNEDAAEAFSKERLSPMIAETPTLKIRVGDPRGRKSENTIPVKHFPGGFIAMVSAGSPMNLSARPVRVVLSDEIDKYMPTKEGDPILLAEERTSTFDELEISLKIRACSPTAEETSRIWSSFQSSDQRRPYMPCPHCKHFQYLEFFRHVNWPKNAGQHETERAAIWCENCHKPWTERQRRDALQYIRWYQTRTFVCCNDGQDPRINRHWEYVESRRTGYALCKHCGSRAVSNSHAGFTASKLYSPNITMPKLAAKWIEAEKDIESKQTFLNTQLALPFKIEATKELASKVVAARRETWELIPDPVCVITVGVDVQAGGDGSVGRLECEVVGWNEHEESWSLGYHVFTGDPAKLEVWEELDKLLLTPIERADGRRMKILGTCIDSGGHNTEEVYKFCLARAGRNVWAIKGASDRGGQWGPVWPAHEFRRTRRRIASNHRHRPVIIGVNAAKEAIRQRLLIKEPGPGYCHFPAGRPAGYFDQLTAERLVVERKGGVMIRRWDHPRHLSNEALDARVYAYAALQGLINDRGFKPARVARILAAPREAEDAAEVPAIVIPPPTLPGNPTPSQPPAAVIPPPPARISAVVARRSVVVTRSSFMARRRY